MNRPPPPRAAMTPPVISLYICGMRIRWLAAGALLVNLALPANEPAAPEISPVEFAAGGLTLQQRLRAQTRIERVWYDHRTWPKDNPGPKPAFEQLTPASIIGENAVEPLRMTAALKRFWRI